MQGVATPLTERKCQNMFVDFLNLFQDPASFFRALPLWVFFALPHAVNLVFLLVVWVASLRVTNASLAKGTEEDVVLFFEGIMLFLVGMWCFMCVDILVFIWSDGIFEANGVAPGGGVVVGRGIWLVLALISTLIAVYCSVAIRKRAYRR